MSDGTLPGGGFTLPTSAKPSLPLNQRLVGVSPAPSGSYDLPVARPQAMRGHPGAHRVSLADGVQTVAGGAYHLPTRHPSAAPLPRPPEKKVISPVLASLVVEEDVDLSTVCEQLPWWELSRSAEEASWDVLVFVVEPNAFDRLAAVDAAELVAAGAAWVNPCKGMVVTSRRSFSRCTPGKWSGSPRDRSERWVLALRAYFGEPMKRRAVDRAAAR